MADRDSDAGLASGFGPDGEVNLEGIEGDLVFYRIRFRREGQEFTAVSPIVGLVRHEIVLARTDHGLEPAIVICGAPSCQESGCRRRATWVISKRASAEEALKFENLAAQEDYAFTVCAGLIKKHSLDMSLVRVERFFNGSKMIFFFTADNRVDFRELVKDLVQEFRTRVEMRQVGVRHETKMLGGIGTCGRELCCSLFMKKFESVSIKMAKEQDLPLNPSKISGVCNRLLCCLTYEYDTYRRQRKGMPKPGGFIKIGDELLQVKRQNPLQESIVAGNQAGEERSLAKGEWQGCEQLKIEKPVKRKKSEEE
ncbi:MAG: regulatory iron-sulfur-containing complex subunit RicT [Desulfocapsaceae bacterium]|nr:regulatory iron-sulfur-containing complex subunit RicT [Desulfocapsaceae bacterium]